MVGLEAIVLVSKLQMLDVNSVAVGLVSHWWQGHDRDRFRVGDGRLFLPSRRVGHLEGLVTLVTADMFANVGAANVQRRLAARAVNRDTLDRLSIAHGMVSLVEHDRSTSSPATGANIRA
jgi:hypothetical protein